MEENVIEVNVTPIDSKSLDVISSNILNNISASNDADFYYANLAKSWAISEDKINNQDYSSKYYAKKNMILTQLYVLAHLTN